MSENMKNVQCVTSLAVFRELYNRQRNVYDVIAEFAKTIIVSKALKSFELQQMCGYLNCEYSLVLTSAVVKTALKKSFILDSYWAKLRGKRNFSYRGGYGVSTFVCMYSCRFYSIGL